MSWIASWVAAHTTRLLLSRRCPSCGHKMEVPRAKEQETVTCLHCGSEIPPEEKK